MTYPEENPLSAKDQLFIAKTAGEHIAQLLANTRNRKSSPQDERLTKRQARQKLEAVAEFVGILRPALACLAIEWAYDENLRNQIKGEADPINFHKAEADFSLDAYADMLTLTAKATGRSTEGKFDGIALHSTSHTSTDTVTLQYRIGEAQRRASTP